MTPRVMLVDDHELLAHSLRAALGAEGFEVVVPPGLTDAEVLGHAEGLRPGIVLLDLHLADDERTSVGLIGPLCDLGATVVMVTGDTHRHRLAECIEAGALGWVTKAEPFDHLVEAVRGVAAGRQLLGVSQ
ncbi:MAG: response regulator transcription factor [Acidimicrobiia bacterium]|nr:response regulator transcription factor [Acidimicrobiia bacterium]